MAIREGGDALKQQNFLEATTSVPNFLMLGFVMILSYTPGVSNPNANERDVTARLLFQSSRNVGVVWSSFHQNPSI